MLGQSGMYIFRSISGHPFRSKATHFQVKSESPVGFVIGKSFQLAASSKAAFVPASSKARGPHPPVSLTERDSSRSPQSTSPDSLLSLPCGEGRGGASPLFLLLYSQLSCRKPPTTRPANLYIECPNQRPINHRRPVPRRRSNRGRKPLSGHDQSGSIATLRSLSLPWSAP